MAVFLLVHDSHGIYKFIYLFALIDIACSRIFKTYQQKSEGGILPFVKGQTNSKWFFQTDVSSNKRMNKFNFTTCRLVFVHFLEESEDTKKTSRNLLTFRKVKKFNSTYMQFLLDFRFRLIKHLKMTVWISVLRKINT